MSELILVTGGARSGKSSYAESLAGKYGDVLYIATSVPVDDEMRLRISKHRGQRPPKWETLEVYKDFDIHLKNKESASAIILDCITVMITNIMFETHGDWDNITYGQAIGMQNAIDMENAVGREICKLIDAAKTFQGLFIMVTNEVGMGIVPDNEISRLFRDIAGRVNQRLAKDASHVYLCMSGIPVKIK